MAKQYVLDMTKGNETSLLLRFTLPMLVGNIFQQFYSMVDTLVVGYPKNMNGTIGERAQACESMAQRLEELFPARKVVLWDERLSTVAAEKVLVDADMRRKKRKQVIDMMAAVVILQNYLDSKSFKI